MGKNMNKVLKIIGVDIGPDECIPNVRVYDAEGKELGDVWGERTARLLSEAEEMLRILKGFVDGDRMACMQAHELINRIENSPELLSDGLTMKELHAQLVNAELVNAE